MATKMTYEEMENLRHNLDLECARIIQNKDGESTPQQIAQAMQDIADRGHKKATFDAAMEVDARNQDGLQFAYFFNRHPELSLDANREILLSAPCFQISGGDVRGKLSPTATLLEKAAAEMRGSLAVKREREEAVQPPTQDEIIEEFNYDLRNLSVEQLRVIEREKNLNRQGYTELQKRELGVKPLPENLVRFLTPPEPLQYQPPVAPKEPVERLSQMEIALGRLLAEFGIDVSGSRKSVIRWINTPTGTEQLRKFIFDLQGHRKNTHKETLLNAVLKGGN